MKTMDAVKSAWLDSILPEEFQELRYERMKEGTKKTITAVTYSSYQARDKEGKPMFSRVDENRPIINTTAYIAFDDGTYGTVKNETALGQLQSETGRIKKEVGVESFKLKKPVKVTIAMKEFDYGDKTFPGVVFVPEE